MDPSQGLFWIAVASSLIMLVRMRRRALQDARGWALKCVLVLATALATGLLLPRDYAYAITNGLWAVIVVLPSLLTRPTVYYLARQHYRTALVFATCLRFLHPFDGWPAYASAIAALRLTQGGDLEQAVERLSELLLRPGLPWRIYVSARVQLCRITGDWQRMLSEVPLDDPAFQPARLRALGETGRLRELIHEVSQLRRDENSAPPYGELFLLAFCGKVQAVADLLERAIAPQNSELGRFWLATAELAAGNTAAAIDEFERLAAGATDRAVAAHAAQRLREGVANPNAVLDAADWRIVEEAEQRARRFRRPRRRYMRVFLNSPVIAALVAANFAVFAVEIGMGGSESLEVLARLGAMWAGVVIEGGEWWRLVAATFLHLGFAHIAFNMAALAILGPWVERSVGPWRTLAIYLLSGVGSTAGVMLLIVTGWMDDEVMVGASGAIFGLVGAQLVLRAQSWRQHRSAEAAQRIGDLAWGIALQVVFDFATPEVSFAGHSWGLAVGLVATLLLTLGRWRPVPG